MPQAILEAPTLFSFGFGPVLVSVTPPGGQIAPPPAGGKLTPKDMGKAPGLFQPGVGWMPYDLRKSAITKLDHVYVVRDNWGGGFGLRAGFPLGLLWLDNDQGREFSQAIEEVLRRRGLVPLRRYVLSTTHHHDAFLFRLIDFAAPAETANHELKFVKGVEEGGLQVLAHNKHAVAIGVHPGTRAPYVWNRYFDKPEDVPEIALDDWPKFYEEVVQEIESRGWALKSGPRAVPASVPASSSTKPATIPKISTTSTNNAQFLPPPPNLASTPDDVRAILFYIPNIEDASPLARFLDQSKNYLDIGYAIFGSLGNTPDAQEIWLAWAHMRPQNPPDHPETRWQSIVNQTPRSGVLHLVGVANLFAGGARAADLFAAAPDVVVETRSEQLWAAILDQWAFLSAQDKYVNLHTLNVVTRMAFNSALAHVVAEVHPAAKGKGLKKGAKPPPMNALFDAAPGATKARDLVYAPGDEMFVKRKIGSEFDINLWQVSPHGWTQGVTETQIAPWLDHVEFVLGALVERDRFLRWSAYQVQYPEKKSNWHWVVISPEGTGKDTMFRPVRLAIGERNFATVSVFELTRDFNQYAQRKMLVVGETKQVNTNHSNAHDLYAVRLKPLLAAPPDEITVNLKNRQEFSVPNRHAVFMFSNERNPLYLGDNSRRVHVIDRSGQPAQPPGYYDKLIAQLDAGLSELVASFLRFYPLPPDIDQEMKGVAPDTGAKQLLQAMNRDPVLDAVEQIVSDARAGLIPEFECLLAETQQIVDHAKRRANANTMTSVMVNRCLVQTEGVAPVVAEKNRIGPGVASAMVNKKTVGARLWRLGDLTHAGVDLRAMSVSALYLMWNNRGVAPPSASVTPLVRAQLVQPPASTHDFSVDPAEEV